MRFIIYSKNFAQLHFIIFIVKNVYRYNNECVSPQQRNEQNIKRSAIVFLVDNTFKERSNCI